LLIFFFYNLKVKQNNQNKPTSDGNPVPSGPLPGRLEPVADFLTRMTTMNPLRSFPWWRSVMTGLLSRNSAGADTNGSAVLFVAFFFLETRSRGGKLLLGYDWSKRFSVEAYYADLGEVGIGSTEPAVPGGDIGYKDYGLSALYYLFKQHDSHRGLAFFLRAGAGKMENETELPYRRLNDTHFLLGAGFQYGFANGVALRSDLDLYDADSRLVTG